jgi:gliding motility-associated-like protein
MQVLKMKNDLYNTIFKPAFKVLFVHLLFLYVAQAQVVPPRPAACDTPPAGFLLGGDFIAKGVSCSTPTSPNKDIQASFNNNGAIPLPSGVQYIFDFNDNIDITKPGNGAIDAGFTGGTFSTKKLMTPGVHYILQIADVGGQKYLKCRTAEIIRTDPPVASIYTWGGTSVVLKIDKNESNKHDQYAIAWGDGTSEVVDVNATTLPLEKTHNYTGTLSQVSLTGFYYRGGTSNCPTSPVTQTPESIKRPVITSLSTTSGGAQIKISNTISGKEYTLEAAEDNGGTYNWVEKAKSTDGTFSITGFDKSKKYCYRISAFDLCNVAVLSNVVCDIALTSTLISSSAADISWTLPTNPTGTPQQLELLRGVEGCDNCLKPLSLFSNLDKGFKDQSLECSKIYNYQLITRYAIDVDGTTKYVTITSDKIIVNPHDASVEIIPNGLIQAGYPANDDSMIRLILLDNSDANQFTFFHKGADDDDFLEIGKTKTNSFSDIAVKPNSGEYCYKYQVEDACGTVSELSPEFCTVFLSYKGTTLNWTDFTFPNTILTSTQAEYTIESFDENIGAWLPQYKTNNLTRGIGLLIQDSDNPTIKLRILAQQFVDIPGFTNFSIPSYSNTIVMPIPADIFIPSAFSPNGDGQNESFEIKSKFVENGTISIYDRWGSIMFTGSLDGIGWDGRNPNSTKQAPIGNYSYKIQGNSMAGEIFSRSGILTLLK